MSDQAALYRNLYRAFMAAFEEIGTGAIKLSWLWHNQTTKPDATQAKAPSTSTASELKDAA